MNMKDTRLLLLLGLLAFSNLAIDEYDGFAIGGLPSCDCGDDKNVASVVLTPASLKLTQGETASATAEFRVGSDPKTALWTGDKPSSRLFKSSSYSASSGETTVLTLTAADDLLPDENWDQGTFSMSDKPKINGRQSGGDKEASAVLALEVWGTQLYWTNPDGTVRTWWSGVKDDLNTTFNPFAGEPPVRTCLADGGNSAYYYLKLNVPGGINSTDWEVSVVPKPVQRSTMADHFIPFYDPYTSTHDPDEYIEKPSVTLVDGRIRVKITTKDDFPGNALADGGARMPFDVVVKRKSDGLTVRQSSSVVLFDESFHLPFEADSSPSGS